MSRALSQVEHEVFEVGSGLRVDRREWFVHQHGLWAVRQCPRDRHPLLHPAGQLPGVLLGGMAEADVGESVRHAATPLVAGHVLSAQRQLDVVPHRQPRHQRAAVVLEHDRELLGRAGHGTPADHDLPAAGREQPGDAAQEGGLARPGRADDRHDLAGADVEVQVLDDGAPALGHRVALGEPLHREERGVAFPRGICGLGGPTGRHGGGGCGFGHAQLLAASIVWCIARFQRSTRCSSPRNAMLSRYPMIPSASMPAHISAIRNPRCACRIA